VGQGGKVDGVMIGRSAYHEPYRILASADAHIFGNMLGGYRKTRQEVVDEMVPFIEEQLAQGVSLNSMTRHMIGLFHGCQGGRKFRQYLSDNVHKKDSGVHTFLRAVQEVPEEVRYGTASSDNPIAGVKQPEI
jgi:tRNA-dihydrouridine synthase A